MYIIRKWSKPILKMLSFLPIMPSSWKRYWNLQTTDFCRPYYKNYKTHGGPTYIYIHNELNFNQRPYFCWIYILILVFEFRYEEILWKLKSIVGEQFWQSREMGMCCPCTGIWFGLIIRMLHVPRVILIEQFTLLLMTGNIWIISFIFVFFFPPSKWICYLMILCFQPCSGFVCSISLGCWRRRRRWWWWWSRNMRITAQYFASTDSSLLNEAHFSDCGILLLHLSGSLWFRCE